MRADSERTHGLGHRHTRALTASARGDLGHRHTRALTASARDDLGHRHTRALTASADTARGAACAPDGERTTPPPASGADPGGAGAPRSGPATPPISTQTRVCPDGRSGAASILRCGAPAISTGRPCELGLCDGSGFLIDEETNTARDCACRPLRIAAVRARTLEARIPEAYREISFEHTDVIDMERRHPTQVREVRRFVSDIDANLDAGRGLWLWGGYGTRQDRAGDDRLEGRDRRGRTVAIYSCPRLLSVIRERIDDASVGGGVLGFRPARGRRPAAHRRLGAEHRTDWVLEQLYTIVNARYQDERSTLVTSNLGRDELAEQLGERIVSRLEGMCVSRSVPRRRRS